MEKQLIINLKQFIKEEINLEKNYNRFTFFVSIFSLNVITLKKEIKFEGIYEGITSESLDENSSIIENFDYSEIKFFIEPPRELENIEFDRPLITDSVSVVQKKLNIIRSITSK